MLTAAARERKREVGQACEVVMDVFRHKTILITGASSGIGRATAERFGSYGAEVALAARNHVALDEVRHAVEGCGGRALVLPTDVTDAEQVAHSVEATAA